MGARKSERVPRLEESVAVIKALWTSERVTHHGRYFHLSDVGTSVRPRQQPRPPIWLGGDVEPAVRRAARIADRWLGSPTATLAKLGELLGYFVDERKSVAGPDDAACPIIRECFVGKDSAHAHNVSRGPLLFKYEAYASWGQDHVAGVPLAERFDEFSTDRFLVGDAHAARDELQRYAETLGVDHLLLRVEWPGLEHREALENIERITDVVGGL